MKQSITMFIIHFYSSWNRTIIILGQLSYYFNLNLHFYFFCIIKGIDTDQVPYLNVGAKVSAKFKGAFCEAVIQSVERKVNCKVCNGFEFHIRGITFLLF